MNDVIIEKLNNIKNCLDRIETKKPFTSDKLKSDFDLQDIISVNLQRALQASVDLAMHIGSQKNLRTPKDMADAFEVLRENDFLDENLTNQLAKSVDLRNVLVHEYDGINWEIVFYVVNTKLGIFKSYISAILKLI